MKKIILIAAAAILLFTGGMAAADTVNGLFNGLPIVKVSYMGKELKTEDTPAVVYNDRTVVPLYFLKQLGYDLQWDQNSYNVDIKPTSQVAGRHKLTSEEIAKLSDRIGLLLAYGSDGVPFSQGTGFIINPDGFMVSAHHVIAGGTKMIYENRGRSTYTIPDFDDSTIDITAVRLGSLPENKGKMFAYLNYSTQLPEIGAKVYALGYGGGSFQMSEGFVQSIDSGFGTSTYKTIRHTAKVDPGASGGALINEYGDVVGVIVRSSGASTLEGYAVPMMYVQQEIDKLKK